MGDLTKAIATIEFSRNTHVEWAAYMRGHKDCSDCNCGKTHPDVNNLGDTAYHENCIAEYDNVLAVLKQVKRFRGELKSLGKHLDSWESQGHATVTIRFLRFWIADRTDELRNK